MAAAPTSIYPTGAILSFVRDFTVRVDGVGDVCSLSTFDFERHGNGKYGAPAHSNKQARSKQVGRGRALGMQLGG